jgi:hypothetical protein
VCTKFGENRLKNEYFLAGKSFLFWRAPVDLAKILTAWTHGLSQEILYWRAPVDLAKILTARNHSLL